jgi:hypothetical protein
MRLHDCFLLPSVELNDRPIATANDDALSNHIDSARGIWEVVRGLLLQLLV